MLLVGWGAKHKPLGLTPPRDCSRCGRRDHWAILETKKQVRLYFVPVAQWNKEIIIQCLICPNHKSVTHQEAARLQREGEKSLSSGIIRVAAAVLKLAASIEGRNSEEWNLAISLLSQLSEGVISLSEAENLLHTVDKTDIIPDYLDEEQKNVLLLLAVQVAFADGIISDSEELTLKEVAVKLNLDPSLVEYFLDSIHHQNGSSQTNTAYQEACETLGVTTNDSITEIRNKYKRLMMQNHPDRAEPEMREAATRKTAEINNAYDIVIGRVSKSNTKGQKAEKRSSEPKTTRTASSQRSSGNDNEAAATTESKRCTACRSTITPAAKFCGNCGLRLS